MKILIADDERASRRLLEATLVRLGHDVIAVSNGIEAMAALLRPDGPCLAILDRMMPGADGLSVCRAVRQRAAPHVYIILLTARHRREDLVDGLDAGADDFLTKPYDEVDLRAKLRSGERVTSLQEQLLQTQEALRVEATLDRLTGLWRRGVVLDQLERELHRAEREGKSLAAVMIDLDHFKQINDTHGHATGDVVLRRAAERLRRVVRDYDFAGRYGGEEFLLVLPGCDAVLARHIAERARIAIAADPVDVGGAPLFTTASLGLAWTGTASEDCGTFLQAADDALYRAKARGRNRVEAQIF